MHYYESKHVYKIVIQIMIDPISKKLLIGAGNHGPVALMYHSTLPGTHTPKWKWAVSIQNFSKQLDLLKKHGWTTVCIRDFADTKTLPPRTVAITFDDGYADNFSAFEELNKRDMRATWFIVSNDIGGNSSWGSMDSDRKPMLTEEQLDIMMSAGMEIGSHTCSHPDLTQIGLPEVEDELVKSKEQLSNILGINITSFAFPYGRYNDSIANAVKNAGYQYACTTRSGWSLRDNDPYRIRRISIFSNDTLSEFSRKIVFADNDVGWRKLALYSYKRALANISL